MDITRKSLKSFEAKVNFGLHRHYSEELLLKVDVIKAVQAYQRKLINEKNIYLSVSISESLIVLNNQKEPHLIFKFINYPRFPLNPLDLKSEIESLVVNLMNIFDQNRIVIEYNDETVMLEYSTTVDPKIASGNQE